MGARAIWLALALSLASGASAADSGVISERARFDSGGEKIAALTLDACGGAFDWDLARYLAEHRIPATLFMTKIFIDKNPEAVAFARRHADLFEIGNHGERHRAAILRGGYAYGVVRDAKDEKGLKAEIGGGAMAIESAFGKRPAAYRGAAALYSEDAIREIHAEGLEIGGYSLSLDGGATLSRAGILGQARKARPGDVLIGHINKPERGNGKSIALALEELRARGWRFVSFGQAERMGMRFSEDRESASLLTAKREARPPSKRKA